MGKRIFWYLPGSIWVLVIFVLSVIPSKELPVCQLFGFLPLDKVGHFVCYGTLIFLFMPVLYKQYQQRNGRLRAEAVLLALAVLYGISIEFIQRLPIVNRSFDVNDMAADALGCLAGYLTYKILVWWIKAAETPWT